MKRQLNLVLALMLLAGFTAPLSLVLTAAPVRADTASELAAIAKHAADKKRQTTKEGQNDRKRSEPKSGRFSAPPPELLELAKAPDAGKIIKGKVVISFEDWCGKHRKGNGKEQDRSALSVG